MATELKLLQRARQWDESALVEIFDRFSPELYRYAMRLLGDDQLAEDCVADSFERLLLALQRGAGPDKYLKAYLYRVAHNWVSDHYRRGGPELTELGDQVRAETQTDETVFARLQAGRLRNALAKLNPDQRQVVALKHLQGLRNQEVAEVVNKTVGAVKAMEQRALANLKKILATNEGTRS